MAKPTLKVIEAAKIMQAVYADAVADETISAFNVDGAQAVLLERGKHRILVIPGTNEKSDWLTFNFNVFDDRGDSGTLWHAGFMRHARIVYTFAKMAAPDFIIGHSLGAASAQIVGLSLQVPTIAFASPRPLRGRLRSAHGKCIVNVNRLDDVVCAVPPPMLGYRHIGKTVWLTPDKINVGEDHRIDKYIYLIEKDLVPKKFPKSWPA